MKIQVTTKAAKKFRSGYPLIQKEDLLQFPETFPKEWVSFIDSNKRFIAEGYLGEQNKGIGWLVSWNDKIDQDFIEQLFIEAKEYRSTYFNDEQTTAFRLFNGEGDGLGGLTIDRYGEFAVFSWYNATLYQHKEMILAAFTTVFADIAGGYEKIRFSSSLKIESQHIFGETAAEPYIIVENGVKYATYLDEGLMTGIFLDQKEVRGCLVDGLASGQHLLNMFSYTGAFSVAAAMGGAAQTTSVDLAKRSLPKTKEQFAVNHLENDQQKIIVMDVFDYFKYAKRKERTYDCIVLDPPSFARNKKKVFSVAKNYGELVKESLDILSENGLLIASTNAANLSMEKYKKMVFDAVHERNKQAELLDCYQLPADFRVNAHFSEGNYLKVLFLKIEK